MLLLNTLTFGSSNLDDRPIESDSYVRKLLEKNDLNLPKKFIKPVKYTRISSEYNYRRLHPIFSTYRKHMGVDLAAPKDTSIKAVYDGVIEYIGWTKGGGNTVVIKHNDIYTTVYYHLNNYENLNKGDEVIVGQKIGEVGSTGWSTGPHLDFRIYMYETPINPVEIMDFSINENSEAYV
jgi:murein DD-endopeptidase MepM/ murein hydrolase activator NlpD